MYSCITEALSARVGDSLLRLSGVEQGVLAAVGHTSEDVRGSDRIILRLEKVHTVLELL